MQMNAKTRSAEAFFSLGSSENILTPGVDRQFYDTIFVFFPAAAGAREPANLSRGRLIPRGRNRALKLAGPWRGRAQVGKRQFYFFFSKNSAAVRKISFTAGRNIAGSKLKLIQ